MVMVRDASRGTPHLDGLPGRAHRGRGPRSAGRRGGTPQPPDTGGSIATSSPSCSTCSGGAGSPFTHTRQMTDTSLKRTPYLEHAADTASATVAPSTSSFAVPAASRACPNSNRRATLIPRSSTSTASGEGRPAHRCRGRRACPTRPAASAMQRLPPSRRCEARRAPTTRRPRTSSYAAPRPCLLYTSDAADDLLCVDLGGRRIIKKKTKKKKLSKHIY